MVNADVFFVFYIVVFGFIGMSRGWVREMIVTFSMVFALFIYQIPQVVTILSTLAGNQGDPLLKFVLRFFFFGFVTFFGYLSPVVARGRLDKGSSSRVEHGLLSFMIGLLNGYIFFSMLAHSALNAGVLDAPQFANLFRAPDGGWNNFFFIKSAAPVVFTGTLLIFMVIVIFLFVIIVLV